MFCIFSDFCCTIGFFHHHMPLPCMPVVCRQLSCCYPLGFSMFSCIHFSPSTLISPVILYFCSHFSGPICFSVCWFSVFRSFDMIRRDALFLVMACSSFVTYSILSSSCSMVSGFCCCGSSSGESDSLLVFISSSWSFVSSRIFSSSCSRASGLCCCVPSAGGSSSFLVFISSSVLSRWSSCTFCICCVRFPRACHASFLGCSFLPPCSCFRLHLSFRDFFRIGYLADSFYLVCLRIVFPPKVLFPPAFPCTLRLPFL